MYIQGRDHQRNVPPLQPRGSYRSGLPSYPRCTRRLHQQVLEPHARELFILAAPSAARLWVSPKASPLGNPDIQVVWGRGCVPTSTVYLLGPCGWPYMVTSNVRRSNMARGYLHGIRDATGSVPPRHEKVFSNRMSILRCLPAPGSSTTPTQGGPTGNIKRDTQSIAPNPSFLKQVSL